MVCLLGVLGGGWYVSAVGVLFIVLYWPALGIAAALFFDLLWGAPVGVFHSLVLPLTALVCGVALVRWAILVRLRPAPPVVLR